MNACHLGGIEGFLVLTGMARHIYGRQVVSGRGFCIFADDSGEICGSCDRSIVEYGAGGETAIGARDC
jgi:hypothetical protein